MVAEHSLTNKTTTTLFTNTGMYSHFCHYNIIINDIHVIDWSPAQVKDSSIGEYHYIKPFREQVQTSTINILSNSSQCSVLSTK